MATLEESIENLRQQRKQPEKPLESPKRNTLDEQVAHMAKEQEDRRKNPEAYIKQVDTRYVEIHREKGLLLEENEQLQRRILQLELEMEQKNRTIQVLEHKIEILTHPPIV